MSNNMTPRYYDELVGALRNSVADRRLSSRDHTAYRMFLAILADQNTKRILFDSRQAAIFSNIDAPEDSMAEKLHPPFSSFYLEFTEPIEIGEPEAGHPGDRIRAFLYNERKGQGLLEMQLPSLIGENEPVHMSLGTVTFFIKEAGENTQKPYSDRTFKMDLRSSLVVTTRRSSEEGEEPSTGFAEDFPQEGYYFAAVASEGRYVGWWERTILSYAPLVQWCCAYLMAKGIDLHVEGSRQILRWHERRMLPLPWHIVKVEPRFTAGSRTEPEEPLYHHQYRYDVIGHLRLGRHPLGPRTTPTEERQYKEVIEWVPSHQRGLANELYIPSTWYAKAGKVIHPIMREYFGGER